MYSQVFEQNSIMHDQLPGQTKLNNRNHTKTKELLNDFVISDNVFGPIAIHASFRKIALLVLPAITNQELDLKPP